jgi:hypothetical protein
MKKSAIEEKVNLLGRKVKYFTFLTGELTEKLRTGPFHCSELLTGLSSQKLWFNPRTAHVKYLVGNVTMGQVILKGISVFLCQYQFNQCTLLSIPQVTDILKS